MQTETVATSSLTLDPANARLHPEENLAAIKASLQRFAAKPPPHPEYVFVIASVDWKVAYKAGDRVWVTWGKAELLWSAFVVLALNCGLAPFKRRKRH
jgi:hypothetical protein